MNKSQIYDNFVKAIDSTIESWTRADRATALEQRAHAQQIIYGIATAALYVLPEAEYHEIVKHIHEKGFNH